MARVPLHCLHIPAIQLQFICNTGVTNAVENDFREIMLLDQRMELVVDAGRLDRVAEWSGNYEIIRS